MAPPVDSQYKDLLNPVKDPEKSFDVNVSDLLLSFVSELVDGKSIPNFNSAALLIQGSASIYGKKVEYLYNPATQLHNSLLKNKNNEPNQPRKETKEKEKKEEKVLDPFLSVDIKIGKNLSCLRRKNLPKQSLKKTIKKSKSSSISIHLLSNDNDEKGDVFFDTRGEVVGNKGDFAMNKCRLISSGWLLLPTVNPSLVPSLEAVPDYYDDYDNDGAADALEAGEPLDDFKDIQSNSDEGFGSYPASTNAQESIPETDPGSQNANTDTPNQSSGATPQLSDEGVENTPNQSSGATPQLSDEGIENTPNDANGTSEGIENVPMEGDDDNLLTGTMPVRQSVRHALRACQLAPEDDPLAGITITKDLLRRRKIQTKNVRCLPSKLKMAPGETEEVCSIAEYCARTFFTLDEKSLKGSFLNFDTDSFDQNSSFVKRVMRKLEALKTSDKKNKHIDPIEDEREINVEDGCFGDANEDDVACAIPFEDNDIEIDHEPVIPDPLLPHIPFEDVGEPVPVPDLPSPDISHIAHEECENYMREVHQFVQNSDITQRVHEWERSVKPFLDELEHRESFDINLYGSRILNAFEDNNRKQTMTFRQFCRNKEKWEIHRYFMALLPLANVGNVSIESELKGDGDEEIFLTLLSRKMHHKELEEFGHSDGSHS